MARGQRRSERSNARGAPQGGKESLICGEFGGDYACHPGARHAREPTQKSASPSPSPSPSGSPSPSEFCQLPRAPHQHHHPIIAGSFNYTGPANAINDENVLVVGRATEEDPAARRKQRTLARAALGEINRIVREYGEGM